MKSVDTNVLARFVVGDDPAGKSSATPNGCEYDFQACGIPVLFPASPDEVLELGDVSGQLVDQMLAARGGDSLEGLQEGSVVP